ncbi:MAG TPA: 30S ribosomal protein S20 [Patescibacteria group bacterium]|nr:30S ribosomal protein S20 [Patescibacteria group bacterium]
MPVIKSAKKKLRQDKKRQEQNKSFKEALRSVIKSFKIEPSEKTLTEVYRATDKATKKHLIHKNKAARIKSGAASILAGKTEVKKVVAKAKKTTKKAPLKKKK